MDVSVEEILHWAFGREKVHLARPPGLGELGDARARPDTDSVIRVASILSVGTNVDSSANLGFEAAADAYVVLRAVMKLPADYGYDLPHGTLPDLAAARGMRVSRHQGGTVEVRKLVWTHAIAGTRPDPCAHPRPLRAVDDGLIYRPGTHKPWFHMVRFDGDKPDAVIRQRMAYLVWRIGLEAVRDVLREGAQLRRFSVIDALPPLPGSAAT